jgi:hypothetical protein
MYLCFVFTVFGFEDCVGMIVLFSVCIYLYLKMLFVIQSLYLYIFLVLFITPNNLFLLRLRWRSLCAG